MAVLDFIAAYSFVKDNEKIKAYVFLSSNGFLYFPLKNNEFILNVSIDEPIKNIIAYELSSYTQTHNIAEILRCQVNIREKLKKLFKENKSFKRQQYKIIPKDKIDIEAVVNIGIETMNKRKDNVTMDIIIQDKIKAFKNSTLLPFHEMLQNININVINYCANLNAYLNIVMHSEYYKDKNDYDEIMKKTKQDWMKIEKEYLKQNYYYNLTYMINNVYVSKSFKTFNSVISFFKKNYTKIEKKYLVLIGDNKSMEIDRSYMALTQSNEFLIYPGTWN